MSATIQKTISRTQNRSLTVAARKRVVDSRELLSHARKRAVLYPQQPSDE